MSAALWIVGAIAVVSLAAFARQCSVLIHWRKRAESFESITKEATGVVARLEAQMVELRTRCECAESLRDQALAEKERNHKMMANWMALYYGSPNVPYPEVFVHVKREESEPEPQVQKRHAGDYGRELDREFREQFGKHVEQEYDQFNQS